MRACLSNSMVVVSGESDFQWWLRILKVTDDKLSMFKVYKLINFDIYI